MRPFLRHLARRAARPAGALAATFRRASLGVSAGLVVVIVGATGCAGVRRASPPAELRVLVLNMHAGTDAAGRDNLSRVAQVVAESNADLVLLQEVDRGVERSHRVDQPAELARLTGRHSAFGKALDYQGGQYGVAILSRWPIRRDTLMHLPVEPVQTRAGGSHEPRGVLHATIDAPGGALEVLNTHLDASAEDLYRRQEAAQVVALARRLRDAGSRVLLGGDFNSTPESEVQASVRASGLRVAWPGCGQGEGLSYPQDVPRKRIDYLFLSGDATCVRAEVLPSDASDHRGVLFVVRMR